MLIMIYDQLICDWQAVETDYYVSCTDDQNIGMNWPNIDNNTKIKLKLSTYKNVKVLTNNEFNQMNLISLDLSYNRDKMEPEVMSRINSFKKLIQLNVSHNEISIIRTNTFIGLNELISLDLSYNKIFYFEEIDPFKGLNSLIYLNLSQNKLSEIEENDLDNMPNIQFINSDFNKIKRIRNNIYNSMSQLNTLSIKYNRINTIDEGSFNGIEANLQNVYFHGNKVKSIENFIYFFNLSYLNLSHNLISVAKFPLKNVKYHVETLDLSYNNISDFFFEYSAELKNLILSNNRLKFKIKS